MLFRLGITAVLVITGAAAQEAAQDRFEKEIRPVLAERCYPCHSGSAAAPQAGLLLDSADGIRRGGNSGAIVRPGEPDRSLLIRAIRYTDPKLKMPPGSALPPDVVARFEAWVRDGAPLPADRVPPAKKQPAGATCPLSGIFVPKQSPNITPKTLEKLKELLLEERDRHVRQAADLQAEADALVTEREQGDTQFDEESGEGDTISVERERDLMLSATANQAVEEIDAALARMHAGTYGLCTPAGRRIAVARLEAIPWAETCVECKQRVERRR